MSAVSIGMVTLAGFAGIAIGLVIGVGFLLFLTNALRHLANH
jgi:hypothetical protein